MRETDLLPVLCERLRAGDEVAARAAYERWSSRLVGLARARLGNIVSAKEDPEDVVQSVYRSFFRRFAAGGYSVASWEDVWAMLAAIAVRKCANRRKRYAAGRRDARREVALFDQALPSALEPTPAEAAALSDTIEALLRGFDPPERAIVELSLQGYSTAEIRDRLGRAERSVQRVREQVRSLLCTWSAAR
jgi:RNA polymerase sigma-70 factor (ECF subfamily)